jgi:hypothetical protein
MEANHQQNNPLSGYFRQPEIYIQLPSKGNYWPEGTLELSVTGELPVYPMTTKDEVTLKTPDALLNGQGMIDVIHSCCPSIKNAWKMPSCDADTVLLGIRIATYGNDADFNSKCPSCSETHSYSVNLSTILESISSPDYNKTLDLDRVKIKLKPVEYEFTNKASLIQFEEARMTEVITNSSIPEEEKMKALKKGIEKITDLRIELLAKSTDFIELTETGTRVSNYEHILEFYKNVPTAVTTKIDKKIAELGEALSIKKMRLKCTECQFEYDTALDFDFTSFFANGF